LKVISLFSGAGGLDLGFVKAGFDIRLAIESDPACCDTLRTNFPDVKVVNERVENLDAKEILRLAGLQPLEPALLIGGPPCQSFSLAGKREGLDDDRGRLLWEYIRVLRALLPVAFVMENVPGLLNWNKGRARRMLIEQFSKPIKFKGTTYQYRVVNDLLNACDFGVAQKRGRVFFVGNRTGVAFEFPKPLYLPPEQAKFLGEPVQQTGWNAIGSLPPSEEPSEVAKRVSRTIKGRIESHGY